MTVRELTGAERDRIGIPSDAKDSRHRNPERRLTLAGRGGHLLRAAVLLTGSMQAGEDLVQAALEQVLPR